MRFKVTKQLEIDSTFCVELKIPVCYVFELRTESSSQSTREDKSFPLDVDHPSVVCCSEMFTSLMSLIYRCCDKSEVMGEVGVSVCPLTGCSYFCFLTLPSKVTGPWSEYVSLLNENLRKKFEASEFRASSLVLHLETESRHSFSKKKTELVKHHNLELTNVVS